MSTNAPVEEVKTDLSPSARFTNAVVAEFQSNSGTVTLTAQMKRTLQNYFVKLDSVLKDAEVKRLKTPENKRDALEFAWKNVNMERLAQECISFAMLGLDPLLPNQLFLIPYKNARTNKFDIGFLKGYRGLELIAVRFGVDIPKNAIIELVYSTDLFVPIKKDINNMVESYKLEITNPFDRGTVIGGFYYFDYDDKSKNFLRMMNLAQIEKRKPKFASPEFWGGEKDAWKDGKVVGKEKVDGWHEEMCYKTIYRNAYNSITIDGDKINDHFVAAMAIESHTESILANPIESEAQKKEFVHFEVVKDETKEEPKAIEDKKPEEIEDKRVVSTSEKIKKATEVMEFPPQV
jgi:recombination protein RecT